MADCGQPEEKELADIVGGDDEYEIGRLWLFFKALSLSIAWVIVGASLLLVLWILVLIGISIISSI
tara:strand:+ start:50 stop:247 length:198 start_codon:yes stop_codon:yes gene_type:complete